MKAKPKTGAKKKARELSVAEYVASLPPDRRSAIRPVLQVMRRNMPKGYQESIGMGMIAWTVPLSTYPDTYNGHPLPQLRRLQDGFTAAGKKLDMGKACCRFRRADDLALDAIGDVVAAVSVDQFVATAEAAKQRPRR